MESHPMSTLVEKIFHFPNLYTTKVRILKKMNGLHALSVNDLVANKEIIDIGCGNVAHFYDPKYAKRRVGIDTSPEMIQSANKLYPSSVHQVASATHLPFPDKSFDIALIQFVLHHIAEDKWSCVLHEAKRVTRDTIIIFDHIKHDKWFPAFIQQTWWNITDGGEIYRTESDWKTLLSEVGLNIFNYRRLGRLFKNICFYKLEQIGSPNP